MAELSLPHRTDYPTGSSLSGNALLQYLTRMAGTINQTPAMSYASYNGGPNSSMTGNPGDIAINIVSSAQTARLYVKESGQGTTTGWVSFVTAGGSRTIAAQGVVALSGGAAKVNTAVVTSATSIFLTDAGGGVVANIGVLYLNGVTSGVSFAIASANALDSSNVNWMITGA